ncbi:hypothetical protein A3K87_04330 [Variovorax paradoxus]|uniref:Uncharacterized protein n=1 Tax=Variovorax paradoxus TaxID=34073 RepID=A0AA91I7D2_VARPD|nr:hypothetical protein [Variovorax paradoxus]OAK55032.1 hypothetical protein A3K87_04330 [Variovorax paradoxus]
MSGPSKTMPKRHLYSSGFKYRDSYSTNIRETFKAARAAMTREANRKANERQQSLELDNVVPMPARASK